MKGSFPRSGGYRHGGGVAGKGKAMLVGTAEIAADLDAGVFEAIAIHVAYDLGMAINGVPAAGIEKLPLPSEVRGGQRAIRKEREP